MRTKIVYVVSSDDKDIILEQALLSVYSLRKHNSEAFVELVVDQDTDITITEKRSEILKFVDKKTVVEVPVKYDKIARSRWIKTCLRNYIIGDFLYIDTDTIVTDNLGTIDDFAGDIGAVADRHTTLQYHFGRERLKREANKHGWKYSDDLIWFNGGVMYAKDSDISKAFYNEWHNNWIKSYDESKLYTDQLPLGITNEAFDYLITEVSGEWNCQVPANGISFIANAKIMHYLAYGSTNNIWKFYDKSILKEIKNTGGITDRISYLVENAKRSFNIPNRIIDGPEIDVYNSHLFSLCMDKPTIFKIFNIIAALIKKLSRS